MHNIITFEIVNQPDTTIASFGPHVWNNLGIIIDYIVK